MQAFGCCQVTRSFVSLYFFTSNEDAEAGNSGLPEYHRPPQTTTDQICWALKLPQTTFYSL